MYSNNDYRSYELYHHGILGQKWGKKQGPPYPLDANEHSTVEKKSNYTKSIGMRKGSRNESKYAEVKKTLPSDIKDRIKKDKKQKENVEKASTKGKNFLEKTKDKWNSIPLEHKETAKKVAIGAAVIGGTAFAGYLGYKVYSSKAYSRKAAELLKKSIEDGSYGNYDEFSNRAKAALGKSSRLTKHNNYRKVQQTAFALHDRNSKETYNTLKKRYGEDTAKRLINQANESFRKSVYYNTNWGDELRRITKNIPDEREVFGKAYENKATEAYNLAVGKKFPIFDKNLRTAMKERDVYKKAYEDAIKRSRNTHISLD